MELRGGEMAAGLRGWADFGLHIVDQATIFGIWAAVKKKGKGCSSIDANKRGAQVSSYFLTWMIESEFYWLLCGHSCGIKIKLKK